MSIDPEDVYASGLNLEDWTALREILSPFLHVEDPSSVKMPPVPHHLRDHPLIDAIRLYRDTEEGTYLDNAGQCLVPSKEPFGWYLPLTK
jgi:hypothetical protein